jgi:hypothetical protein
MTLFQTYSNTRINIHEFTSIDVAVENVVCPYCGKQTPATVQAGTSIQKVQTANNYKRLKKSRRTKNACQKCGKKFYAQYSKPK